MSRFVHLHLHSEYSLLDGACRIEDIPLAAKAAGNDAVAITDHGVMYGAVSFFRACEKEGIKPIIGCEVYVSARSRLQKEGKADSSGYHLVLLCKNEIGYKNLITMVSSSFIDGFYAKPRIDLELLEKHHEGLVALSGCLAGYIPRMILLGDMQAAEAHALFLKRLFGDDFYLEIQNHRLTDELTVCRALLELSKKTGIPLVATNDVHYIKRSDAEIQATLLCIQTNNVITDGRPIGFETDEFYYKSTAEMAALFASYPDALENSARIADKCNFRFTFGEIHLPTYPTEGGLSYRDLLHKYAKEGLYERHRRGQVDFSFGTEKEYLERIEYELSVIDNMGFNGYYLIVRDFIAYAKAEGIPVGPGRGSGAGSMVAYCVGITDIDPFRFDLLFERFLNPERITMPDFDTDLCYMRRDEVIAYVRRRYGDDHVAQIVTFGTLAARAAVRDVGRAMGLPYGEVDAVARLIPHALSITIKDALQGKELSEKYESSPTVKKLLDTAMALEGMPRHASTHAAGIVITDEPISAYVPLATNGDVIVTQYDMDTVAALGLVKFDLLGLRYLTILADAEASVRKKHPEFSLANAPIDDEKTYALLSQGQTNGVFQLEKAGMRRVLTQMRPRSIYDITAVIALYRPGPMASIPHYLACREGREAVTYATPELREILGDTYGCIVYQEQVMQIFRRLAGYSFARADLVRRAMSKKKADVMEAEKAGFIEGAKRNGIDPRVADGIFSEMQSFAEYAFNKSHAAAYAMLSFRTAYLKVHYPKEYMAALLTSVLGDQTKIAEYIGECARYGIKVLPPDINESTMTFSVSGEHIRFGLLAILNVGRPFISALLAERERRPFTDFEDFLERMSGKELNRRQVESLIKCGAFDRLGVFRSRLLASYERMMDELADKARANVSGQLDIFSMGDEDNSVSYHYQYPDLPEYGIRELLTLEKESSGMYFSGHMIEDYRKNMEELGCIGISEVLEAFAEDEEGNEQFKNGDRVTVGGIINRRTNKTARNGQNMAFITLEDRYGEITAIVFPKLLSEVGALLQKENAVAVTGKISAKEGEKPEILLQSAVSLLSDSQAPKKEADKQEGAANKEKRLFLRVDSLSSDTCRQALRLCERYRGKTPLVLYDSQSGRYVTATDKSVFPDEALLSSLCRLLGAKNVILQ